MKPIRSRRRFLQECGISAAVLPFVGNLSSFAGTISGLTKKRLLIVFSPDGVVKDLFWPKQEGKLESLPPILAPLESFRDRMLVLKGVCDKVRGDGDGHMRGMGCLLTGTELFPGNIQGGSDTPAGWSSGPSIDQEIKNYLQSREETRTRFGSLEFGVLVPDRADTWTRMVYAGPNKPVAPIDDPYQMFAKLYGRLNDQESVKSVLDDIREDLARIASVLPAEDRRLLEEHTSLVRDLEKELTQNVAANSHPEPKIELGVLQDNDQMPKISRMQIELVVASLAADFTRVATLQFTNSVGQARMKWLGVDEGQHDLSHEPNSNGIAQEKLVKINAWYAGEVAHLARRLAETPEPGNDGSLLDHTTIVWTNELGEGNSHTLDDIPWVLVGSGLGFTTGRAMQFQNLPHNRLLLSLAHAMGHLELNRFGNPDYCIDGPLTGLV
ncbi:MAG: DUF1552 domain-containing protein [Planctomycetota bacterium]|jgi:hypothetical protein|nr:DUF1552 domain-containing protein [Planctomycetia bacterium]RLS60090.1 MAG: DUF1552 domain-containing protein [Planctomycetota bacterium]TSA01399.1 MAG: DUF1552 domain-containing protein [Planctomycetaceae bacterium]